MACLLLLWSLLPFASSISLHCASHPSISHYLNLTLSKLDLAHSCNIKIEASQTPQCIINDPNTGKELTLLGLDKLTHSVITASIALVKSNLKPAPFEEATSSNPHLTLFGSLHTTPRYIHSIDLICRKLQSKQQDPFDCYFVDVIQNPIIFAQFVSVKVPFIKIHYSNSEPAIFMTDDWPNYHKFTLLSNTSEPHTEGSTSLPIFQCADDLTCNLLDAVLPEYYHQPRPEVLLNSRIKEAPQGVRRILNRDTSNLESSLVLVTYIIDECSSCENAVPHLDQLRQHALTGNVTLYFINCTEDSDLCSDINGYPSLVAYRANRGSLECSTEDTLTSVSYHGAFITSHLIDWYTDVADQNIHYGPPHAFHTGCNIHLTISSSVATADRLSTDCMLVLCTRLGYTECFITGDGAFVSEVVLERRDGVVSTIYQDSVPLSTSFASTPELHIGHSDHRYNPFSCQHNKPYCYTELAKFIKAHSRMPLTELTPLMFHTRSSFEPLFNDLPISVVLLTDELLHAGSEANSDKHSDFMSIVATLSTEYYRQFAFTYVNIDRYPSWSKGMSPASEDNPDPKGWVYQYPRLVIFSVDDHYSAAMCRVTGEGLTEGVMRGVLEGYLKSGVREPCHGI